MIVSEIMNKAFIVEDNISLKNAAKIMSDKNIGSLLIVKDEKIKGIITERDIMRNISKLSDNVSKVMSTNIVTINLDESIEDASDKMIRNKVKRLPVIENEKLVGIITMTDIVAHIKEVNEEEFLLN